MAKPIGPICNLDCEYCFYLKKEELFPGTKSFRMTDDVLERFTRQYIAAQPAGTSEVNFAWQGGEPTLMGVNFFRRAIEFQDQYKRPGLRITNSLQTDGALLDDEWGAFLQAHNFLVGMSSDGPEVLHDRYRLDKQGRGTFHRVMAGLEVLRKHDVEFNTLTVIQNDNGDHPEVIYDFLKEVGSRFYPFIPIVEKEHDGLGFLPLRRGGAVRPFSKRHFRSLVRTEIRGANLCLRLRHDAGADHGRALSGVCPRGNLRPGRDHRAQR